MGKPECSLRQKLSDARSISYVFFAGCLIDYKRSKFVREKGIKMNTGRSRRRFRGTQGYIRSARNYNRRNTKVKGKFTTLIIIICLSAAAGYLTATYLIGPALGLETAPLVFNNEDAENSKTAEKDNQKQDSRDVVSDQTDKEPDETEGLAESGYVLQYGSFSSKEAAENCINDLKRSGIEAEILEKDGAYKVVSPLFDTEEDARSKMENQKDIVDVFITQIP